MRKTALIAQYWWNWVSPSVENKSWHMTFWEAVNLEWDRMNKGKLLENRQFETCWDPDRTYD